MVKSYDRYEQDQVFGVITSQSNIVWLPPSDGQSKKSAGRALTSGIEEILVWDIKTGEILQKLQDGLVPGASNASTSVAPSAVSYLTYNEASNVVASGYNDGSIKVWDLASSSVIMKFQGHKSKISALKFDTSGTRLISGSSDCSIILWDLVGEEGLFKLKGHKSEITDLSFISHGDKEIDELDDYVISVSKDGLIKLWEITSKQCIETHIAHSNECWSMGINHDNNLLITSGNKDQVKVWSVNLNNPDMSKLQEKGMFEKQSKSKCQEIKFEKIVKSGEVNEIFYLQNNDRTIEMFRIRNWSELQKGIKSRTKRLKEKGLEDDEILENIKENEVGMMITPFTTLRTLAKIRSCSWVKNGKSFNLLISLTNNSIELYNMKLPENIRKIDDIVTSKVSVIDNLGHRNDIRSIDISKDNEMLVTVSNGELKIWNLKTFNVLRNFQLSSGYALCVKFLPGSTLVVVGYKNGDLELFDLAISSTVDKIEQAHKGDNSSEDGAAIWSLDLTPDGKTLITGGNDKLVKFWDFKVVEEEVPGTNEYIHKLKFNHKQTMELSDEVLAVKVSPNGKLLAISLLNNNVQVIYLDSFKLFLTLYGHKLPVLSIDISQDNKMIITSSADKNIKIWGLDFGDCHKSIFGHQDSIMNVRFIGDSHNFFSSGKDGLIKYWDGDKFECIQKLPGHQLEVWSMAVSSDGLFMVSASHDHSIRLWSATNDQVFLEEEREKQLDEIYEDNLLESLENEQPIETEETEDSDEVSKVNKQTTESLKAGEKLIESIDIGFVDLTKQLQYEADLKQFELGKGQKPSKPDYNAILKAYNLTGEEYVFKTINEIKPSQLEDALLILPFSYTLKLIKFIEIWSNKFTSLTKLQVISKILNFIIKSNLKEIISQKDPLLKNQLINIKTKFRHQLTSSSNDINFNIQGLKFIKDQWKLTHDIEFIDNQEQVKHEDSKAIKRNFVTI